MASPAATPCALHDTPLPAPAITCPFSPSSFPIFHSSLTVDTHICPPLPQHTDTGRQTRPTLTQETEQRYACIRTASRPPLAFKTICAQPLPYARPLASYRMQASWLLCPLCWLAMPEGGRERVHHFDSLLRASLLPAFLPPAFVARHRRTHTGQAEGSGEKRRGGINRPCPPSLPPSLPPSFAGRGRGRGMHPSCRHSY